MTNLSAIIAPTNVVTTTGTQTLSNKTIVGSFATPIAEGTVYGKQTSGGGTPFLTALGYNAAVSSTGASNVAVGTEALFTNTTGNGNTAVGYQAGYTNSTAIRITAVGGTALYANTVGGQNSAFGYQSMRLNTTGANNTAVGDNALYSNTTASGNTAVGRSSLESNTTGANNVAVGLEALNGNTTASNNTAAGHYALQANTTGATNTAVGGLSLYTNTTGGYSTALGYAALTANTTGNRNTAVGYYAGGNITTGTYNHCFGFLSGTNAGTFDITTQSNRLTIGDGDVTNAYVKVAWTVTSDARDKTEIQPVPHGLNFVNQLNPVSFKFKKSREDSTPHGATRYGFLAQEVLAIEGTNPVVIDTEQSENLKYIDQNMTAILVKAIQELKAEFDAYKLTHP